ncbi:hypothetical protein LINPERPRIM_LOCUS29781 [Linum perenne]
MSKSVLEL